jgi:hypothetical protein
VAQRVDGLLLLFVSAAHLGMISRQRETDLLIAQEAVDEIGESPYGTQPVNNNKQTTYRPRHEVIRKNVKSWRGPAPAGEQGKEQKGGGEGREEEHITRGLDQLVNPRGELDGDGEDGQDGEAGKLGTRRRHCFGLGLGR